MNDLGWTLIVFILLIKFEPTLSEKDFYEIYYLKVKNIMIFCLIIVLEGHH